LEFEEQVADIAASVVLEQFAAPSY